MGPRIHSFPAGLFRLARHPDRWKFEAVGYCPCCDARALFAKSVALGSWLTSTVSAWSASPELKASLPARENSICMRCSSNFRMRAHAATLLRLLGMSRTTDLAVRLEKDPAFAFYETAAYNIFRFRRIRTFENYLVSEYFDDLPPGSVRDGIRNENLESLTFPDGAFDVVVNSDVLEHVADVDLALSEVRRILKPGGYHVFTVPADPGLPKTVERARVVDGRIEHLLEPVTHGDTVRPGGVLVFRDFGRDVLDYVSRDGLECREERHFRGDMCVTSVYYARKVQ